jgi:hypothetical protein
MQTLPTCLCTSVLFDLHLVAALFRRQDHANVILERIKKWRATQLTPWKAKAAAGPSPAAAAAGTAAATSSSKGSSSKDCGKSSSSRVEGPVARVYSVYSSMPIGSSCLGLHREGFLQLLRESRIIGDR